MANSKETFEFGSNVSGDSSETETTTIEKDCTVYRVDVRWYRGPALGLVLNPFVDRGDGHRQEREDLVSVHGRDGLVGDNDQRTYYVDVPVERTEQIGVKATNQWDPANWDFPVDFDFNCRLHVDYEGGTESSVFGRLAGVFG